MATHTRFWTRLGMLGGVYAVLFLVAVALTGNQPSTGAAGTAIVKYYQMHRASQTASVFVIALAVVAFTFFLASLRHTLSGTDEGRHLANVITAGGGLYAAGLMLMGALTLALVDAAKHHLPATAQTLNVLSNDLWAPVVAGLSLVGLGTAAASLRSNALPKWLTWVSVAFGVVSIAGPAGAIAFLLAPVWAILTGVVILRSARAKAATTKRAATPLTPAEA